MTEYRPTVSKFRLMQDSIAAEKAWMAEVIVVLGARDASMARFQERANGAPGTKLNELYNSFVLARDAYAAL